MARTCNQIKSKLNASAFESHNELDLFGACGETASVIHVLADEAHKCQAV